MSRSIYYIALCSHLNGCPRGQQSAMVIKKIGDAISWPKSQKERQSSRRGGNTNHITKKRLQRLALPAARARAARSDFIPRPFLKNKKSPPAPPSPPSLGHRRCHGGKSSVYSIGRSSSRMYHQYCTMGMMNEPAKSTARTEVYLSRPSSVSSFFLKVLIPKSVCLCGKRWVCV